MMRMNCWVLRFFATIDVLIPNSRWKIDFVAEGSKMYIQESCLLVARRGISLFLFLQRCFVVNVMNQE
jgi:hypothetical protein